MNPRRGQVEKFISFSSFPLVRIYICIHKCACGVCDCLYICVYVSVCVFYLGARGSREKGKEFYNWTPRATLFFFLFYLLSVSKFSRPAPFEKVKRKVSADSKMGVSYLRRPYKPVDRFNFVFFRNHEASLFSPENFSFLSFLLLRPFFTLTLLIIICQM